MEGGTKHVTLRRFEPYRPSCTNLTPTRATASGSALLFWLCSFRILLWQPVLSRILRHRARRRGTRRGAAAVTPVMTTQAFWDHIA